MICYTIITLLTYIIFSRMYITMNRTIEKLWQCSNKNKYEGSHDSQNNNDIPFTVDFNRGNKLNPLAG